MTSNNPGHFVISLDFELFWGVRDSRTFNEYKDNIKGVWKAIPAMLDLFALYDVRVTFATVGFLFCRNKDEIYQYSPGCRPDYNNKKYSPYEDDYISKIGDNEDDDPYHFAPSLIKKILSNPQHEVATHTFSHYYCLEGASLESFKADIVSAINIARMYKVELESIVFPRNQYSEDHLKICRELGINCYRGNESSFAYRPRKYGDQNYLIKLFRLADSYVNLFGHHCVSLEDDGTLPVNLPSSRFLRPFNARLAMFEGLKINRIKKSMSFAAGKKQLFHLWWHPHNFGRDLDRNLKNLESILKHYKKLNLAMDFQSVTMKELARKLKTYG